MFGMFPSTSNANDDLEPDFAPPSPPSAPATPKLFLGKVTTQKKNVAQMCHHVFSMQNYPAYDLPSPLSATASDVEIYRKYENLVRVNDVLLRDIAQLRVAMKQLQDLAKKMESADKRQITDMESNGRQLKQSVSAIETQLNQLGKHSADLRAQIDSSRTSVKKNAALKKELEHAQAELQAQEEQLHAKTIEWKIEEARLLQAKDYLETRTRMMADALQKMAEKLEKMEQRCLSLVSEELAKDDDDGGNLLKVIETADASCMTEALPANAPPTLAAMKDEQKRWRI